MVPFRRDPSLLLPSEVSGALLVRFAERDRILGLLKDQDVMVTGPAGSGKTLLLRAMAEAGRKPRGKIPFAIVDDLDRHPARIQGNPTKGARILASARDRQRADPEGRFAEVALDPLGIEETRTLWAGLTGADPGTEGGRPIQILTSGITGRVAQFALSPPGSLEDRVLAVADACSDGFRSQEDGLPALEHRAFLALAGRWTPSGAAEVAADAGLDGNRTSVGLRRLQDRGLVVEVGRAGRKARYEVADRLMGLYLLLRAGGPGAERVRSLLRFMEGFYGLRGPGSREVIEAAVNRAARGDLGKAPSSMEPLAFAMRILDEEEPPVPREIADVGRDLVLRVQAARAVGAG
jgi:energy-coupling factor transporter ATP-binding protein EcfA2